MNRRNLVVACGIAAGSLTLLGCAAKTKYPSYYILNVPAPVVKSLVKSPHPTPILGSVAVREFRAPAFLTSGPIVYLPSAEQVAFYNYHHWAEDPRKAVTAAVIRELQSTEMFQSVDPFDGRGSPSCLLTGTLDHLEEVDNGSAVSVKVSLSARLVNVATGELLWQGTSSRNAKVDERSVAGVVAEMSSELGIVVEQLVASMQNRLRETLAAARRSDAAQ